MIPNTIVFEVSLPFGYLDDEAQSPCSLRSLPWHLTWNDVITCREVLTLAFVIEYVLASADAFEAFLWQPTAAMAIELERVSLHYGLIQSSSEKKENY